LVFVKRVDGAERSATPAADEFEQLYVAHVHGLTIQLYAYTGDLPLAEDLVQEAFCRALARWRGLSTYDDPVAWVRQVAWNLARTRWRRLRTATDFLRRQRQEPVAGPSPDRVALAAALARLPAAQRRAVILHYLADLPIAQVADEEKVAIGTVKARLFRGRAALATQLRESEREDEDA
jgi:RNA polymerase sigma-70 factor, ECF subfamily